MMEGYSSPDSEADLPTFQWAQRTTGQWKRSKINLNKIFLCGLARLAQHLLHNFLCFRYCQALATVPQPPLAGRQSPVMTVMTYASSVHLQKDVRPPSLMPPPGAVCSHQQWCPPKVALASAVRQREGLLTQSSESKGTDYKPGYVYLALGTKKEMFILQSG